MLLAIEAGNVFDEDNATMLLLERGADLEEDIWHKLLILSLNYDIVGYMKLAFRLSIPLHHPQDEGKISIHKAVCCHAVKILKHYADCFAPQTLLKMIDEPDFQGLSALEYAKLTERPEIVDMIVKMRSGVKVTVPEQPKENEEPIPIT